MGKLQKAWEVVGTLIKNPQAISQVLKDEELGRKQVQEVHGLAQGLPTVDLLDLFPNFDVTVDPYSFLEGTSTILDIALLNALARSFDDCHYLEIGTWRGESVANVARFATKCVSVSLSEAELRQFGFDEAFVRVHQLFSAGLENVQHIGHNSRTFDFAGLPERFDLNYIGSDGEKHRPVIVHRTILGSIERFFGILIEHFAGKFPVWLAPVQVMIIPVADAHHDFAKGIAEELTAIGVRASVDGRDEKLGYRIREAQMQKVPYMLVVGDKEAEGGDLALRIRDTGDAGLISLADLKEKLTDKIKTKSLSLE